MSEERNYSARSQKHRGARQRYSEVDEHPEDVPDEQAPPERFSRGRAIIRTESPEQFNEFEKLDQDLRDLAKRYGWDVVDRHWVTVRRQIEEGE